MNPSDTCELIYHVLALVARQQLLAAIPWTNDDYRTTLAVRTRTGFLLVVRAREKNRCSLFSSPARTFNEPLVDFLAEKNRCSP